MSSHRLSVSGDRPSTITAGGPYGAVQYNAKVGDRAQLLISNAGEITAVVPQNAILERWKVPVWSSRDDKQHVDGNGDPVFIEYVILRIPSGSISLTGLAPEGQGLMHTNIDVRKDDESNPLANTLGARAELIETTPLASPPTK